MSPSRSHARSRRPLALLLASMLLGGLGVVGTTASATAVGEVGSITGSVTGGGLPLNGVYITALGDPSWQAQSVDGGYTLSDVPEGVYSVNVSDPALDFAEAIINDVVVVAGEQTTLDVVMQARPNYTVSGAVTDENGPVEGVTVVAAHMDGSGLRQSTTDVNGLYSIDHLAETTVNIWAGGAGTPYVQFSAYNQSIGASTTLNISLTTVPTGDGVISGTIVDQTTLLPIEGINLSASIWDISWSQQTTTDIDGYYEFTGIPNGVVHLTAYRNDPPAYVQSDAQLTLADGSNVRTRDFTLHGVPAGDSRIEGHVTSGGGPVVGLSLSGWLYGYPSVSYSATTDADGYYEFTNLPAGIVSVNIFSSEFAPLSVTQQRTVVGASSTVVKDLDLARWTTGDAQVSGTVLDTRTGLPVPFGNVFLYSSDPLNPGAGANINTAGEWSITGLPAGTYTLTIETQTPAYLYQRPAVEIIVAEHDSLTRTDYLTSLAPGISSISGKISDNASHLPIQGADISLYRNGGGFAVAPIVSAANGSYSFTALPDGLYSMTVMKDGYQVGFGSVSVEGPEVRNVRLIPLAPVGAGDGVITGTVVDLLGHPVAEAPVNASALGLPGWYESAMTDVNGEFELVGLPLTGIEIYVDEPYLGGVRYAPFSGTVTLSAAAPEHDLEITLLEAASISGFVTSDAGDLAGNLVVRAINADTNEVVWSDEVFTPGGEYAVDRLPAGDYVLQLAQQSGFEQTPDLPDPAFSIGQAFWVSSGDPDGSSNRADATVFTVVAGQSIAGVDFLVRQGGAIGGHVDIATPDGTIPLPAGRSVAVKVYHLDGAEWTLLDFATAEASQYSDSEFIVSGLAPGDYKLEFVDQWEGNRAYKTTYDNGAATLAGAPVLHVAAGIVTHTGTTTLTVVAPSDDPFMVDLSTLSTEQQDGLEGGIAADTDPVAGDETTIMVGEEFAGEWVAVWGNSTPTMVSTWVQVASDGSIDVTLPSTLVGTHKLIVQDADQQPLGWTQVQIAAPTSTGGGSGTGGTPGVGSTKKPAVSVEAPAATPTPSATPTSDPVDDEPATADNTTDTADAPATAATGFNWLPIAIVGGVLLLVFIAGAMLLRRRAV